jgi:hypothetical protein
MLIAYMLSTLAKSMSVTLPVLMLLLDIWPLQRLIAFRDESPASKDFFSRQMFKSGCMLVCEKIPLFAVAGWISYITVLAQGSVGAMSPLGWMPLWVRIVNAVLAYADYVRNAFYPSGLCIFYVHKTTFFRTEIALAAAFILTFTGLAWATFRKRPVIALGWAWFVITLLPVIGLVQVGSQGRADRYFYFPSIGLILMTIGFFPLPWIKFKANRMLAYGLGGVWAFSLGVYAYGQVKTWKSGTLLFADALENGGHYSGMYVNLSNALCSQLRSDEAMRILDAGLKEYPDDDGMILNRLVCLMQLGRYDEALEQLFRIQPARWGNPMWHVTLATIYHRQGKNQLAFQSIQIAKILIPRDHQWDVGLEDLRTLLKRPDFNMDLIDPPGAWPTLHVSSGKIKNNE